MTSVRFKRQDAVGSLVLANAPLNLIGLAFATDFQAALGEASEAEIRCLLIRSDGPNFSQGGDVAEFAKHDFDAFRRFITDMHLAFRKVEALQVPTVCAVRGRAWGGGFELALACDLLIVADDASLRFNEPSVGTAPTCGGVQRFAQRAGAAHAARYGLLGEQLSGTTAGDLGVASFVVADADVEATARELAVRLADGPTLSYIAMRALLKAWGSGGVAAADQLNLDLVLPLSKSEDAAAGSKAQIEAMKAGMEPAPVVFKGK